MGFGGGRFEILGCHDEHQRGVVVLWVDLGLWGSRSRFSLDAEKTMGIMDFVGKMNSTRVRENDGVGAPNRSGRGRFA